MSESTDLLTALRGAPEDRPTIDPELKADLLDELRGQVPRQLGDAGGGEPSEPLQISKEHLTKVHQCEGRFVNDERGAPSLPMARGILVHSAIRKTISGESTTTPQALAEKLVRTCEKSTKPIGDVIRALDKTQRAEFVEELVDYQIVYSTMFPRIPKSWGAAEVPTSARVSGPVTMRGVIDLKLGVKSNDRASTVLIDFKTGRPSNSDRDDLRFYSLIETLGTGGQPFRFANVYLNSATCETEDVAENTLRSAARRLGDGMVKIMELKAGRPPTLTPGPACRFCPAKPTCASAVEEATGVDPYDF